MGRVLLAGYKPNDSEHVATKRYYEALGVTVETYNRDGRADSVNLPFSTGRANAVVNMSRSDEDFSRRLEELARKNDIPLRHRR
ncbi:MAG: hypothetical protein AABX48_03195 [Nanoarchaeota archaeon]